MKQDLTQILLEPIITEKSTALAMHNKYTFKVPLNSTKSQIKKSFELLFPGRKVLSIKTSKVFGHTRRTKAGYKSPRDWKKTIVSITGDRIEYFPEST